VKEDEGSGGATGSNFQSQAKTNSLVLVENLVSFDSESPLEDSKKKGFYVVSVAIVSV
jgi:hypothetical protein